MRSFHSLNYRFTTERFGSCLVLIVITPSLTLTAWVGYIGAGRTNSLWVFIRPDHLRPLLYGPVLMLICRWHITHNGRMYGEHIKAYSYAWDKTEDHGCFHIHPINHWAPICPDNNLHILLITVVIWISKRVTWRKKIFSDDTYNRTE